MSGSRTDKKRPFASMDAGLEASESSAKRFLTSGQFSDLTITCKGKEWKVHKFQLCGQSDFFFSLCTSHFKEAQDNKVPLDDDDPHVVEAVIEWIYQSDYTYPANLTQLYKDAYEPSKDIQDSFSQQPKTNDGRMLFDVEVYTAADKFFISKLKDASAARFKTRCEQGWATEDFPAAISMVFQTPAGFYTALKTPIMTAILDHRAELLAKKFKYPALHAVMRSNADFSTAVAVAVSLVQPERVYVDKVVEKVVEKQIDRPVIQTVDRVVHVNDPTMRKYRCPYCNQLFSIGPMPTPRTEFGCPRNCIRNKGPQWWQRYAQA